jgi:hypothetical protein
LLYLKHLYSYITSVKEISQFLTSNTTLLLDKYFNQHNLRDPRRRGNMSSL